MPFPISSPGLGSTTYAPRSGSGDSGSISLALDNMIRNQLKVSDPRNPKQVADALLTYYQALPQAASITQEAQGLPFLLAAPQAPAPAATAPTSSDQEFAIARNDVERALTDLSTNALTNDIIPEMQGLAQAIRTAITDGSAAARQGLDPRMRDRVMGIRRQLGEYARLARLVGTLYPGMMQNFRRLGQSLDEVAAVLLVMLGEALASVGFASGYFLLQVPFSELAARRDAVIYALRNFMGGAQQAYGPDDWPRGINAYRTLFNRLEQQGQGDLRVLLTENEVAHIMDELISRAQNGTAEGLRALGVTAQLDIERFKRLAIVAPGAIGHENSPPLAAFLEALLLFADAFQPAGGLRLLKIARPPVLFYGLYNSGFSPDDRLLIQVITARGALATLLDSLFLGAADRAVVSQVLFDMLIAALDRIIDLLAMEVDGSSLSDDTAKVERAFSYWLVVRAILMIFGFMPSGSFPQGNSILGQIDAEPFPQSIADILKGELTQLETLAAVPQSSTPLGQLAYAIKLFVPNVGQNLPHLRSRLTDELLIQKSLEKRWRELVRSVAPEAARQEAVFAWLQVVIMQAFSAISKLPTGAGRSLPPPTWQQNEIREGRFPPQFEQSLAYLTHRP